MRLADADVLPYDYTNLAETIHTYIDELEKLASSAADEARERNLELEEGSFAATNDPHEPTVAPPRLAIPPHISFAPLRTRRILSRARLPRTRRRTTRRWARATRHARARRSRA